MTYITVVMMISLALIMMNYLVSKKLKGLEENSPFECGFDPKNKARLMFSSHFFILTLVFLIFDVEIAIIVPMPLMTAVSTNYLIYIPLTIFSLILVLGVLQEWILGMLTWKL